jgi:aldose 1-epimerase
MAVQARLELCRGDLRLQLAPAAGGAVAGFWRDGAKGPLALLRPLPEGQEDALRAGMFPMVPFANCIRDNRFTFAGRDWQVEPNMPGVRLNFHGSAWRLPWQIAMEDEDAAVMVLEADDGIWRYHARQDFALGDDGLEVTLSVTNRGAAAMPFGFGLHPWFPRHGRAIVRFEAEGLWQLGSEGEALALGPVPEGNSHAEAAEMARRPLNLCYDGWAGLARIDWPDTGLGVTLTADSVLGKLMVHVPTHDIETFCLEPQSNAPCGFDALARGRSAPGIHVLAPGETLSGRMSFHVSPLTSEPYSS